jgi:integrase
MSSRRANGEGQIRRRPDGRWEARYRAQDGRRFSLFGKTKGEVAQRLRDAAIARDRGAVAPPGGRETVASFLETWLMGAQPSLRPMTFQSYESIIRTQLAPRLGHMLLSRLRPQHVQRAERAMLAEGFSPKYVRNCHGVLHRALDRAVQWHELTVNPADGVDLPSARPGR